MRVETFGSHIEIQAAARVFKRNIRVVMSTTSFTIPWETESFASTPNTTPSSPTSHNNEKSRMRTRSSTINLLSTPAAPPPSSPSYATALAEYIPPIRPGRSMLWLALFSQAEHFQSVRRKGDGDSGAAEVEDRLTFPHEKDLSEAARRERGETPKFIPTERGIDQVLASLPPDHGITPKQAVSVLPHVKGNLGEAVEILLEEIESDSGNDHRVDEMLAFRTTSPAETTTSSSSEQGTGTSQVTTPSAGSAEVEKAKGGLGGDLVEMGKLEVASQPRGRGGVRRGRGRGRGTGGTVRAR